MQSWLEKRKEPFMQTSPTQHETFDACRRKWWLKYIRGLFTKASKANIFGDILHLVCERYLNADDLGYDETGNPVELYPENWHVHESGEELTPRDQALIKSLIEKAIEDAVLERVPGREIEYEFKEPTGEYDAGLSNPVYTRYKGFIDVRNPGEIQDHKTSKSTRWLKSAKKLKENLQILSYAYVAHKREVEAGGMPRDTFVIRHNQYVKDPDSPKVKKTEAIVSLNVINNMWNHILRNTKEMVRIRATTNDPLLDLPNEPRQQDACRAYGGCEYADICGGLLTVEDFLLTNNLSHETPKPTQQRGTKMNQALQNLMGQLATVNGNEKAEGSPPPVNPPVTRTPEPVQEPAQEPATQAFEPAPWADPKCGACNGTGFNSKGSNCRICLSKVPATDLRHPTNYTIKTEAGKITWEAKDGSDAGEKKVVEEVQSKKHEVEVEVAILDEEPQEPQETKQIQPTEPEPLPEEDQPKTKPRKSKSGTAPRKKTFTLLINCSFTVGGRDIVYANKLLQEYGAQIAQIENVEHFTDIDAFKRRDMLTKTVDKMLADELKGKTVIAPGVSNGTDIKYLVDALESHASDVIRAFPL